MSKILIIEDEESFRAFLVALLEDQGYDIHIAEDGEEGLERLSQEKFDLVITDIIMPGKEGFEVCREMITNYPDTEVIAMSGGVHDYLKIVKALGVKHTFGKPFEIEKFLTVVHELTHKDGDSNSSN